MLRALAPLAALASFACLANGPPLAVVPELDLERYSGRWYEIASYPQRFQQGCVATTADYRVREDGDVEVVNSCREETLDGELRSVTGVAWQPDPDAAPAKLRVRFFWPFWGSYWIVELDPDYRWAVVGHPSRDYLWILSRTPRMEPALYRDLLRRIEAHGFTRERLVETLQPEPPGQDA